ncbi:DUF6268 family outer membrane beta-barrel protein [Zhouia sp. PK063]|uniref:DUF6268 family outer membrane beta-barrel protein n=1 Tax=Zhouia sp. PK063 TaxID=3373602 RepID=UPI0037B58744
MIKIYKYAVVATIIMMTVVTKAQEKQPVGLSYSYYPLKENNDYIQQLQFKLLLPIAKSETSFLGTGIGFLQENIHSSPNNFTDQFYAIGIPFLYQYRFNNSKSIQLIGNVSINSTFKKVTFDDAVYVLGASYIHQYSKKLKLGYGVVYVRQFFGNQIVPLLNINYKPSDKWTISGRFPVHMQSIYAFNKKNQVGIEWRLLTNSFRLDDEVYEEAYIKNRNASLQFLYRFQLWKQSFLSMGLGYSNRLYEVYTEPSSNITLITFPLKDNIAPLEKFDNKGMFLEVGMNYILF